MKQFSKTSLLLAVALISVCAALFVSRRDLGVARAITKQAQLENSELIKNYDYLKSLHHERLDQAGAGALLLLNVCRNAEKEHRKAIELVSRIPPDSLRILTFEIPTKPKVILYSFAQDLESPDGSIMPRDQARASYFIFNPETDSVVDSLALAGGTGTGHVLDEWSVSHDIRDENVTIEYPVQSSGFGSPVSTSIK